MTIKLGDPVSREVVERIVNILGPSCAAYKALSELDKRLSEGESVAVYQHGSYWVIGPAPADEVTL